MSRAEGPERGFDHRDPDVEALMGRRSVKQGIQIGSSFPYDQGRRVNAEPLVPMRRATSDVTEMRRRTREHHDPLGVDDREESVEPPAGGLTWSGGWTVGAGTTVAVAVSRIVASSPASQLAELVSVVQRLERLVEDGLRWVEELARTSPLSLEHALDAFDRLQAATIAPIGALDPPAWLVRMAEMDDDEPRAERRRHGHASMCPRHGPTRGGLCRRCNR